MLLYRSCVKAVNMRMLLIGATALVVAASPSAQTEFPYTRQRGQAAVEYKDDDIHIVAAYYYSQRNHDSRWLLIEAAVSTTQLMTIHRDAIVLRTPQGREIPLATQSRFSQDMPRVRSLVQSASVSRHGVTAYFNQRERTESMKLFALPFQGIVHDDFVVDVHRVALGDLYFEAPTGLWEPGTYSLVVRHEQRQVALPIELE